MNQQYQVIKIKNIKKQYADPAVPRQLRCAPNAPQKSCPVPARPVNFSSAPLREFFVLLRPARAPLECPANPWYFPKPGLELL